MEIHDIPIAKIRVSANRRSATPARVQSLVESIREIGLQHPVGVVTEDNGYRLVHGRHRLMAFSAMGRLEIPCIVMALDALLAELAELDENLCRSNLTKAEQAKSLARRKEIYEALHPETKAGVAGGKAGGRGREKIANDTLSFASDTAAKTGQSKRSVERAVKVGSKLDDKALAMIACHPIADNQSELKKLAEYDPTEQREICGRLARGKLQRVPEKAREAALAYMEPGLEKAIRDDLDAVTTDVVALSKLSNGEQKAALKAVRSGEFGSLHDWLHGKPVESIKEPEPPAPKPAAKAKPSRLPIEQQFRPAYDYLGKFKRELDGLMRQADHPNYRKIMALADKQSDLLTEWKESRK